MDGIHATRFFRYDFKGQPKWVNVAHILYVSRTDHGIEVFLTGDTDEGSLIIQNEHTMERFTEFMDQRSES